MGFEVNPYDPCVANKTINGLQMTVTWHMDDLKVSYKESTEVTKLSCAQAHKLNTESSTEAELVCMYDTLPDILLGRCFIETQGHISDHNGVLQDKN